MSEYVEVGPVRARRGERAFGVLPIGIAGDGGRLGIHVHVIAGRRPGPKLVVMSTQHGYEIQQISILKSLYETVEPEQLRGTLVLIPVANPVAFEMGVRCTWIDTLWGDNGNMNRLWPGRPHGSVTERFCHAIASHAIPGATAVIDLHASSAVITLAYGYVGLGQPGDVDYDISLAFGHEILVYNTADEVAEKRQQATSKSYFRSVKVPCYSCEIAEFYGLDTERGNKSPEQLYRGVPEVGVTGIKNVMKYLGMLDGDIVRPSAQIVVQPELNIRPSNGGLLVSNFGVADIGRVVPGGTVLGTVLSPYTFEELETITAPFVQNLLLGAVYLKPYTRVNPGNHGFIVADWDKTQWLTPRPA
jgi:predicted deacylase